MNDIVIRIEETRDRHASENLVREAFWNLFKPGCDEHLFLHRLREGPEFVPELALVAEDPGGIVGCIASMRARVVDDASGGGIGVICLGPLAAHTSRRGEGIGSRLVHETLARARALGFPGAFLFGHPGFYPRFGFADARRWNVATEQGANFDAFMGIELFPGGLAVERGRLVLGDLLQVDPAELERFDAGFPPLEKGEPTCPIAP